YNQVNRKNRFCFAHNDSVCHAFDFPFRFACAQAKLDRSILIPIERPATFIESKADPVFS
ncbi:hypothetical protein, partial [Staphylococcus haemolyticus]|uniref:hypothetical protein n=1 Tax=Staphylococcus haemolyticus TaxID=1283 RepID=UPI0030C131DE